MTQQTLELPGPVALGYYSSSALVSAIMGPVGGGKTTTSMFRAWRHAAEQKPSTLDGVRRFILYTVRDTYRNLWTGTIPSWFTVSPKDEGKFIGSDGEPARHVIQKQVIEPVVGQTVTTNATIAELTHEFFAIGEHAVEEFMRSKEPTAWNLEEADLLPRELFEKAIERCGRRPRMNEGGPTWYGVMMSFNAPDVENWLYAVCVEHDIEGVEFFQQPAGNSGKAENLKNLPPDYYANMAKVLPDWEFRRKVLNEWGYSRQGLPVYAKEWNDGKHCATQPLELIRGLPLIIGLDAGMDPAAVFMQHAPNGQWRWYKELVSEHGTGPKRFARLLNQVLAEHFSYHELSIGSGAPRIAAYADPSSFYGADSREGDQAWAQIVQAETGIPIRPAAANNKLVPRYEAVRFPLTHDIEANVPGLVIDPSCRVLRRGFLSEYRYRREQVPGQVRYTPEPDKNSASHVMEAGQYGILGGGGLNDVMERRESVRLGPQHRPVTEWNPLP
jgi:hypothetical protein